MEVVLRPLPAKLHPRTGTTTIALTLTQRSRRLKLSPAVVHLPIMDATPDATLAELTSLGMRAARVVTHLLEIEDAAATIAAACLPATGSAESLAEAAALGQALDAVSAAMAQAVPRTETLARALDRLSRSVRYSIALRQRLQAGWPRSRAADDRPAMLRKQVARRVADVIRNTADGEAAERLFSELAEHLDDPALAEDLLLLPVEEIVRRLCRDLGLVATALQPLASRSPAPANPPSPARGRGSGLGLFQRTPSKRSRRSPCVDGPLGARDLGEDFLIWCGCVRVSGL